MDMLGRICQSNVQTLADDVMEVGNGGMIDGEGSYRFSSFPFTRVKNYG